MAKPSYLGVLNAISVGERRGHALFEAWSSTTKDRRLKKVLKQVAIREMEHSWAFEKRLSELGFSVRQPTDAQVEKAFEKHVNLLKSEASDAEKYRSFGFAREDDKKTKAKGKAKAEDKKSAKRPADGLLAILADQSIDPETGALMGRFICEERDTVRRLRGFFEAKRSDRGEKAA